MNPDRYILAGRVRGELDDIMIPYLRQEKAHAVFDFLRAHQRARQGRGTRCVQMIGPSGAGKSKIIEDYAKKLNTSEALARREIPILVVEMDENATSKGMAKNILEAFENYGWQPPPMSGDETTLLKRVRQNLKAGKVQLLIIDEFQHVLHRETHKVASSVGDTIKSLLIKGVCPIVMVGIDDARRVVTVNPQLRRRAEPEIRLTALTVDDRLLFADFMANFLEQIALHGAVKNATTLTERESINMLFEASEGVLGCACDLIKSAITKAIESGRDILRRDDLAQAMDEYYVEYDAETSKVRRAPRANPFRDNRAPVIAAE